VEGRQDEHEVGPLTTDRRCSARFSDTYGGDAAGERRLAWRRRTALMQIATSTGEERAAATNAVLRLRAVRSRDPAASNRRIAGRIRRSGSAGSTTGSVAAARGMDRNDPPALP
jgi:hypothetical protein